MKAIKDKSKSSLDWHSELLSAGFSLCENSRYRSDFSKSHFVPFYAKPIQDGLILYLEAPPVPPCVLKMPIALFTDMQHWRTWLKLTEYGLLTP